MLRITSCLLIVIAAAGAPWLLGGFSNWCYLLAPVVALAGAFFWFPLRRESGTSATSWYAAGTAALLIGYIWLQATPLPSAVISAITSAPRIERLESLSAMEKSCESDEVGASTTDNNWKHISSDPPETRRQWVVLATALGICVIAMTLAGNEWCRLLMIFSLTINGALFGILAIVQRASAPRAIYWTIKPQWASLPFGAFVNRNHAGLFLALSGLCALFGICLLLSRRRQRHGQSGDHNRTSPERSVDLTELRMIWMSQKDGVLLPLAFCALFCAVSSIVAASRSGALAFGVVIIISALMLFIAGADRRLIGVIGVLGAVAAIISSAKIDYLLDRFGGDAIEAGFAGRYSHWVDVLDQYPEYALTGVGLGSYAYSTLPYLSKSATSWYQHADNQYVEVFVELGLVGLALVACLVGLLAARCIALIRTSDAQARIVGLFGLGLIGIGAINSVSDFALAMAGVLLPMALATGVVLGYRDPAKGSSTGSSFGAIGGVAIKTATAMLLGWAAIIGLAHFANGQSQVDAGKDPLQWAARQVSRRLHEPSRMALVHDAQAATDEYLRQVEIAVNAIDRGLLESDDYSLENLALLKRALTNQEAAADFRELQTALDLVAPLKAARHRHLELIKSAPMRFESQLALARIDLHLCAGPNVSHWVNHARGIHPTSGVDASKAGIVSVINGDFEAGGLMVGQALREAPELEKEIYSVLRAQMSVQEVKKYVIGDDAALLIRAADHYYDAPQEWAARSYLYSQLRQSIEAGRAKSLSGAESKYFLAKAKYMTGDRQGAFADFEAACREQPPNQAWLRELAALYQKDGKIREAIRVVKTIGQEFGYDEKLEHQLEMLQKRQVSPKR